MQNLTAKLFIGHSSEYSGTAWLYSKNYALTAAHCVGDRQQQTLHSGPFRLAFDWGEIEVQEVKRIDFGLDAALLRVPAEEISDTLSFTDCGILPRPSPWPHGQNALWWSAFGFPLAHSNGMTINGVIDSLDGRVEDNHAIQLTCEQGGFGALNGMSGAAILHNGIIIGLIRYGPPALKQKVIYAAPSVLIASVFPELKATELVSPVTERHMYSQQDLSNALSMLLPAQFESVIFTLNVPSDVIPGPDSPRRTRAMEVVKWAKIQSDECFQHLADEIRKEAPGLLKSK